MNERITPALFDSRTGTTGLITKYSDFMRYYVHPDSFRRIVAEDKAQGGIDEFGNVMPDEMWKFDLGHGDEDESWDARQAEIAQHRSADRLVMERNLNTLVGTAEEREEYASLVRQYIEQTNVDEQAMLVGRQERQERLMELERDRGSKLDDMIADASMSGQNTEQLQQMSMSTNLDQVCYIDSQAAHTDILTVYWFIVTQSREALVGKFKQTYPELPGALGPAYSSIRNHISRLSCQEDFDAFLSSFVEFSKQLKLDPQAEAVELVSDAELITNADYLDRIAERLHEMQDRVENSVSADTKISPNIQHLYASKLQSYREDWWKFQGLLVLAGRADECSLAEDFSNRLIHPSEQPDL